MSLMSRDDYEQEIRRLERRQAELGKLLSSCIYCDAQLGPIEISADWLAPWGEKLRCEHCGNPRETALSADAYAIGSREIERLKQHAKNKLIMTGVTIADAKKTMNSGLFAWVIGAKKQHEKGCGKLRDQKYCSCEGLWIPASRKGIRIRHGGKNWIVYTNVAEGIRQVMHLQAMGITVMEYVFHEAQEKKDKPEREDESLPWQKIPIEQLPAYANREGWMIRWPENKATAEWFEACEVGA